MKSTRDTIRENLKIKFAYLESELEVYQKLTAVLESYNGKKVDKRIQQLVQEALPKYHVHYYKQDYYIRLAIEKIGYIHRDKRFLIPIHYMQNGVKFDFEKFDGKDKIPGILHRKLATKKLIAESEPDNANRDIEDLLILMQEMKNYIAMFHAHLQRYQKLKSYLDVEDSALIRETAEFLD
jgi:hypothetical protein